jgi:predicted alpha/beta superfamily hydrolase
LTYKIRVHPSFPSVHLPPRAVRVALPPGYDDHGDRRYPVLYLQDGQNLFGDDASPVSGRGWRVDSSATRLLDEGAIEPVIFVGIDNAGERRADEYTPTRSPEQDRGGSAALYGGMLVQEIKPFIDEQYRTRPGRQDTGLGGSSFGALVSLYVGLSYPDLFGKLALLSLAPAWNEAAILGQVAALQAPLPTKIWLDFGTAENDGIGEGNPRIRDALVAKGWAPSDLEYHVFENAQHTEDAWAARFPQVLSYLFPASP